MEISGTMIQSYLILIILLVTMILFVWGKWRFDVVAMIALMVCVALGLVPFSQMYTGLSNPAVITVACVMVISNTISRSGVLDLLVQKIGCFKNNTLQVTIFVFISAILSAFMNNVGALALMMPVVMRSSIENNLSPSKTLMPIAFASILGGLTTAIGTPPNLLVSSYRQQYTGHPFTMFDFSDVGVPVACIGLIFIALIGWRLMPSRRKTEKTPEELYQVQEYVTEIKIPKGSPVIDSTIEELENLTKGDVLILGIIRDKTRRLVPQSDQKLKANDILIIETSTEALDELIKAGKLELAGERKFSADLLKSDDVSLMEAVIPEGTTLDGQSTQAMHLRSRYHINLLAIARQDTTLNRRIKKIALRAGDVLLLQGKTKELRENVINLGLLPLAERDIRVGKSPYAYLSSLIFFVAILLAAFQILPIQVSFGGAVLSMVLFRALPVRMIYSGIDWSIIVLLATMIPIGSALQTSGATNLISTALIHLSIHFSPILILVLLLLATMILSDFMNNSATAIVMCPIAVGIAQALKLNIDPFLMTVAIGASCSCLTPISHQNNTLVMGPGGYRFSDYIRLGMPVEILTLVFAIPVILWAWPLK